MKSRLKRCLVLGYMLFHAVVATAANPSIIPSGVTGDSVPVAQHPLAAQINTFIKNQAAYSGPFTPTGLNRTEYLRIIEGIVKAMKAYQNASGQIVDPVKGREFQYSTPCYAHAVSALFAGKYSTDTALLSSGIRAMDAGILHMIKNDVPDGHGDFFTVPLMLAYGNFKNVPGADAKLAKWRTDLGAINPATVYRNSAPNWIGINTTGEFLRYKEGMTSLTYVSDRILYQITRMGKDGLYQDSYSPETLSVVNTDGNSVAYDNVARAVLGIIASGGYTGSYSQELDLRLWRGAWSGLFYQSPFGEVPTGMRSSHHFWNEAEAAINYELWAAQYRQAGKPEIAGAFKRAAMISLSCVGQWLRPDGSGYVTKARYPIAAQWGYMAYSSHTQYNLWTAAALAAAWQYADTTIREKPAPCEIGGFVTEHLPGFKKIFANAGGTYVEFDIRGDHSHNPTGLLRIHCKAGSPQLGPSDGAVGKVISGAQYWPLYNETDPANLQNLSVGPSYLDGSGAWYPVAELQVLPTVSVLQQTMALSSFRVAYPIYGSATLYETVIVEPRGVTVVDSIVGGNHSSMRVNYPLLRTDGIDSTKLTIAGNQLTAQLKGKGTQFKVVRPSGVTLTRTNILRNHRNGKCEQIYGTVPGRVAEYFVSAWPEYATPVIAAPSIGKAEPGVFLHTRFSIAEFGIPAPASGPYRLAIYSMQGRLVGAYSGNLTKGISAVPESVLPRGCGIYRAVLTKGKAVFERKFPVMK